MAKDEKRNSYKKTVQYDSKKILIIKGIIFPETKN